jgi:hypothetical protein
VVDFSKVHIEKRQIYNVSNVLRQRGH